MSFDDLMIMYFSPNNSNLNFGIGTLNNAWINPNNLARMHE